MNAPHARPSAHASDLRVSSEVLLESITDAVVAFDHAWRFIFVNAAAERYLQRDRELLLSRVVWEIFPQHQHHENARRLQLAMSERRVVLWEAQSALTGHWQRWRCGPIPNGGVAAIIENIEDRVHAERALRASEDRLQTLANLVPAFIWLSDRSGEPEWCNRHWLDYAGSRAALTPLASVMDCVHNDDQANTLQRLRTALASGQPLRLEHRLRRFDGEYRWFLAQLQPIRDGHGEVVQWGGVATDIQELRDALAAEREARAVAERTRDHCRRVFAQAPLLLAVFRGPDHTIELVSDLATTLFERPLVGRTARAALPERERQPFLEILNRVYATGIACELKEFNADSSEQGRVFDLKFDALKYETGEVYGVIAIGIDVTASVRAREHIECMRLEAERQREELARVFEQAPFAVAVVKGPRHVLRSANAMQLEIIGKRPALDRSLPEAFPEPGMQGVYANLAHVFATGETIVSREQPIAWRRGDSEDPEEGHFDVVYQPIRDATGAIEGVLTFTVEVSESVRARAAVAAARDEAERTREHLRAILAAIPTSVAVTRGPNFVFEFSNPAHRAIVGRDVIGHGLFEIYPDLDRVWNDVFNRVYETGEAVHLPEARAVYDRTGDGQLYEGYFNSYSAPLFAPDGTIEGVVTSALEVTEQVHQRERIQALRSEAEAARGGLEQAHALLETRIAERTIELERANAQLAAEIRASSRAEAARRELLRRLASAREDEQRRTARDLHDQVGQTLSALMLAIKAACDAEPLPKSAAARLNEALRLAEDLGRDVHELASRLRPALLDDLGLHAAVRQLLTDWSRRSGIQVDFQASWLERTRLPAEAETVLYRVVQEAMTNIARHAHARTVSVVLERHEGDAIAVVEDDGVGFDQSSQEVGRLGLVGMRERVMLAGGWLDIESAPGGGTTVIARIPIHSAEPASRLGDLGFEARSDGGDD